MFDDERKMQGCHHFWMHVVNVARIDTQDSNGLGGETHKHISYHNQNHMNGR